MALDRSYSLRESSQWCWDAGMENRGGRKTLPSIADEPSSKTSIHDVAAKRVSQDRQALCFHPLCVERESIRCRFRKTH